MKLRPLFALAILCLAIPALAAPRFGALIEAYENLQVGPASPVSNLQYTVGHMKLTLSGSAAPVMAGQETAGIFFKGNGSFQYTSVDPIEAPVMKFNMRKETDLEAGGSGTSTTASGSISELLILASGQPLPELTGSGGESLAGAFKSHMELFDRAEISPYSHLQILEKLAFPSAKVVRMHIHGSDNLLYVYDPIESHDELLADLSSVDSDDKRIKARLYPVVLSQQPIDRDRREAPKAPFMLTALDYTLVADGDNAKLTAVETISRQNGQQSALRFNMNQYIIARVGGAMRTYHVTSVKDDQGHSLPFHHDKAELLVGLEETKGDTVRLTFNIEGDFLVRPNNDNAWQLGTTAWFPQPELNGQYYTLHSVVKVKKPFVPIAPGKTVRRAEEGEYNVVENVIDKPVQFAVVHAGKYEFSEETKGGLTVRVASYAGKNERAAKQLTSLSFAIIDYFQYFLGPFPFDEFNIVQVNTFGYGQAPPATMFITNEAFNSTLGLVNQVFSQGVNERFAHEIAHQYWGHVVKMPTIDEDWLNESFAEYSAALALKKFQGDAVYNRLIAHWKSRGADGAKVSPIPLAWRVGGDDLNAMITWQNLTYFKGAYLLYKLHKELGDETFLTFMKSYQKSFRWKYGSTQNVAGLLQFMTKKDYGPYFDQYFWGTAMPN
ncbi:MAG TPA: M1 family aminopeptidase [Thermoanaerobaculia bacterium]|nr:M1 family aminopeptidase [Thermoanaerobaculia bacterium]